ncbi:Rieske (2Fe-2S) protein [Streptomyces sp. NPDC015232]|uniref:Rieske (2Fe-2S) protein n=1 Tax=unclassified Streptomyces TaxID=2593676 RepID=UPI0037005D8B
MTPHPMPRRRTVLRAGAGSVAASALVAGCGSDDDGPGGTARSASPSTPPAASPSTPPAASPSSPAAAPSPLARTADIPVGGGTVFADEKVVVTQPVAGEFKAFSAVCTHQGCTVAKVADGTIDCPCHGSRYRIADGSVAAGPAPRPLPEERIKVSAGTITLA